MVTYIQLVNLNWFRQIHTW